MGKPYSGVQLPRKLLEELGIGDEQTSPSLRYRVNTRTRKDRRKAARIEKRAHKERRPSGKPSQGPNSRTNLTTIPKKASKPPLEDTEKESSRDINNIEDSSDSGGTPEPISRVSKAKRERLAQDDAEIKALERALGVKNKLPKSFADDGLDELLDGLGGAADEFKDTKRRREEGLEWLRNKRQKSKAATLGEEADLSDVESASSEDSASGSDDLGSSNYSQDSSESDFQGFDEGREEETKRPRENPYRAPVEAQDATSTQKYIPPSLRIIQGNENESLQRVRRQVQGLLNKISDANMLTILSEFENLYRDNARQVISSSLIDRLMELICDSSGLQDTFLVLHAGFIASVYKVVGADFGAHIVQRIVEEFQKHSVDEKKKNLYSKTLSNLISLLADLYVFRVVSSGLIYDYIRHFVSNISEINTELLLKVIRHSGPQLRQDDPSSMKEIIIQLHSSVSKAGEETLSVRTKFMVEIINDLKNNKVKKGVIASSILSEHTSRMKKLLGTLNTRNLKALEPLRITLDDIRNSDKRGKWWLVGASYRDKDNDEVNATAEGIEKDTALGGMGDDSVDLLSLAKAQHMNTDIRRSIFVTIMSATDYKDAHLRLIKLNLKRSQEVEIPKVLIHCTTMEESYNPYYALLACQMCAERRFTMTFQFSLWDLFKRMGESTEDPEDTTDENDLLSMRAIVNLANMYGLLIAEGRLGLTVLKNLNFPYIQQKTKLFLELLFINVIVELRRTGDKNHVEQKLHELIMKIEDIPGLASGVRFFVRKVLRKTDLTGSKKDQKLVQWACGVLEDSLKAVS